MKGTGTAGERNDGAAGADEGPPGESRGRTSGGADFVPEEPDLPLTARRSAVALPTASDVACRCGL